MLALLRLPHRGLEHPVKRLCGGPSFSDIILINGGITGPVPDLEDLDLFLG